MAKTIIPVNTVNSNPINTSLNVLNMIYTPANLTCTSFTFLVANSLDGIYHRLVDGAGNAYSVTFTAGDAVPVDATLFASVVSIIIVAGTTELTSDKELGLTFIPR